MLLLSLVADDLSATGAETARQQRQHEHLEVRVVLQQCFNDGRQRLLVEAVQTCLELVWPHLLRTSSSRFRREGSGPAAMGEPRSQGQRAAPALRFMSGAAENRQPGCCDPAIQVTARSRIIATLGRPPEPLAGDPTSTGDAQEARAGPAPSSSTKSCSARTAWIAALARVRRRASGGRTRNGSARSIPATRPAYPPAPC